MSRWLPLAEAYGSSEADQRRTEAVSLAWTVLNATSMRLERLSGPGPGVDAMFAGGPVVNGTQPLNSR